MINVQMLNETVFGILRESLFPKSFPVGETEIDEAALLARAFSEMQAQTVSTLADQWLDLQKGSIDESLYIRWKEHNRVFQIKTAYMLFAQQKIVKLLDDNGIKSVVIKGAAASMLYPDPFLRQMGDIDLLVKREDFGRVCELMQADEYEERGNTLPDDHHKAFVKYNITFEIHRRLPIVDENNEELIRFFEDGIDEREFGLIDKIDFPVMPVLKNGLVLLFHINQHIRVGLGLRQIVDWMMFVDKYIDTEAWEREYRPVLEKLKLDRFAKVVTKACVIHLGLGGDRVWCMDADSAACDGFIEYVMQKGNFAIKSSSDDRIASVFMRSTNPFTLIARSHRLGVAEWPAANKYKILRPFASVRHGFKVLAQMKKKKVSMKKLNDLKNEGLRQREFIESIGLEPDRIIYEEK